MIESRARRLKELTERHFHGLIDFETYRAERSRLLDSLLNLQDEETDTLELPKPRPAGALPAAETVPAPKTAARAMSDDGGPASPERATREFLDHRQSSKAPPRRALWLAVALVATAAAVILGWPLLPDGPSRPAHTVPMAQPSAPAAPASDALIEGFLALEAWDEAAVSRFLFEWDALSDAEQAAARDGEAFRRFVAEMRRRIMVDRSVGAPAFRDGLSLTEALSVELDLGLVSTEPRPTPPLQSTGAPELPRTP